MQTKKRTVRIIQPCGCLRYPSRMPRLSNRTRAASREVWNVEVTRVMSCWPCSEPTDQVRVGNFLFVAESLDRFQQGADDGMRTAPQAYPACHSIQSRSDAPIMLSRWHLLVCVLGWRGKQGRTLVG